MMEPDERAAWDAAEHDDEPEHWEAWPACPNCRERRQAVCPICETAGTEFPLAEWIPTAPLIQLGGAGEEDEVVGTPPLMLMCTTCDEAFAPNFYERCEHCGYDFTSGVVIEAPEPEELNLRMLVVLGLLVAVTVGLIVFFSFVLR